MSGNRFWLYTIGLGSTLILALALQPQSASACGGFFCSATAPINQAAERIIFSKNEDGTVTAVVQIQYSGPSEEFAWVLPVPGIPDVNVSSDLAFTRLQQASNPQYILTTEVEGDCRQDVLDNASAIPPSFNDGGGTGGAGGNEGVNVLASGTVGPYDYVVIQPDASFEEVGDVVVDWLIDEGYDVVPPGGDPNDISELLGTYLQDGMNLLAFRLTKGNDAGTIRPIRITYASSQPMIPIRPTAVAANDDMGVMVWVLGESRAVPVNYRSLELNEALIDWTTAGSNYNQVVVAAADEAGGQGFVTERAGQSEDYDNVVLLDSEQRGWDTIRANADRLSPEELLILSAETFGAWDGYRSMVERFLPESVDVDDFLACPRCGHALVPINKQTLIDALGLEVVDPMIATQELLTSRPYVTRLYTTLSAPEMDLDPLFDFNPDLQDASNLHNARRVIECNPTIYQWEAPSRIELEDGRVVRLLPNSPWPFTPGNADAPPANAIVAQLSTSGPGTIVTDNSDAIDEALDEHNATVPTPNGWAVAGSGGCTLAHGRPDTVLWIGLALLGLLVKRRRTA